MYTKQKDEKGMVTTTATVAMAGCGGLLMDESEVRVSMYVDCQGTVGREGEGEYDVLHYFSSHFSSYFNSSE